MTTLDTCLTIDDLKRLARRRVLPAGLILAAALSFGTSAWAAAQDKEYQPTVGQEGKDVIWVPTPQTLVEKMLDIANVTPKDYVIDLGSGDGRIPVTAAKRFGIRAVGIDIDPAAVLAARNNAMQNRAAVQVEGAEYAVNATYDVVLANILANPLKMLAPWLARAPRSGGRIALSGILDHQADEVLDCYAEWFDMSGGQREDGWVLLVGSRR